MSLSLVRVNGNGILSRNLKTRLLYSVADSCTGTAASNACPHLPPPIIDICKLCFDSYDLHDVADTKVMSEFLHREGGRYWTTIDGVRQLYRRIECKMCFEVIEKLKGL